MPRTLPRCGDVWSRYLVAVALACTPTMPALAAPEHSEAQILFEQGRRALERGDEAAACKKFEESLRLARSAGPLFNLAMCEEHQGHLVEAARNWREALSFVPPDDARVEPAFERLAALDKKLGRLTISLPVDTPANASLLIDGVEVPQRAAKEGSAGATEPGLVVEVAPGEHKLELAVRGRDGAAASVSVAAGEKKDVALDWPKPKGPEEGPRPKAPDEDRPDPGAGVRIGGIILGSVGVTATVVGSALGILTILKRDEVDANCTPTCNDTSREAATDGEAFSLASSITFPTGLAMTAAGAIMIFTHLPPGKDAGPRVTAVAPLVTSRFVGLVVGGTM